ncbi:MAG TPA: ATP-binding protein [Allosphingosinicella sp.]|jgi:anti-sigma regulatory factor (Ser/Thr protein kinase)|uniref:ATP-binding protein n=1 Tax=Allosphingosinicella sp. TaxID=2823234 RepID=UPI002F2874DE
MGERESNSSEIVQVLAPGVTPGAACDAARDFATAAKLATGDAARLCILVEELVTNVVEHGGSPSAEVSMALEGRSVRIILVDAGDSFDPRTAQAVPPEKARGGGAGLAIVRAWADVLSYESGADGNRLELVVALRG